MQKSYDEYEKDGWKGQKPGASSGTKGGGKYENNDNKLPSKDSKGNPITYKEYDVNNKSPGKSRDGERFVVGSDGKIYYTNDHYGTFKEIGK